jgi:hypothetical protein
MNSVLSYGGGVQTVAMGRMIIAGELPPPDLIVFADTMNERRKTYEAIEREYAAITASGLVECVRVSGGNLKDHGGKMLPVYNVNISTGELGRWNTVCSERFKTRIVNRELRRRGWKRAEVWLGLSLDEVRRVKPNPRKWLTNRWPLIELNMRRADCENVLRRYELPIVKSACKFCPNACGPAALASLEPDELAETIAFDAAIRNVRPGYLSYIHDSHRPLSEVVADDSLQTNLFDREEDECGGVCFS